MFSLTPVVKNLLILNIGIYIIQRIQPNITDYLCLFPTYSEHFIPTQLFTNIFVHEPRTWGHIFNNMFSLLIFGPLLERFVGDRKTILLYIIAGLSATALHVFMFEHYYHWGYTLLGASGAVMGIKVAAVLWRPNMEIYVLFFPMKIKYFLLLFIVPDILAIMDGGHTGIAHFAHLGGALAGAIMVSVWKGKSSY